MSIAKMITYFKVQGNHLAIAQTHFDAKVFAGTWARTTIETIM